VPDAREPPLGAGEAAATTVPAARANTLFDAVGIRLRTVPFTRQRVLAALA
jgi:CO/xanthine dehydrogenase Mo-binding subunit